MNKKIQSIGLISLFEMRNHNVNAGEDKNPKSAAGHTTISGQKIRHCLFSAADRINRLDADKGRSYVSNGDGINWDITTDIRGDIGGYLFAQNNDKVKENDSEAIIVPEFLKSRVGPMSVPMSVALDKRMLAEDLFVRFESPWNRASKSVKENGVQTNEQRINGLPFSVRDMMPIGWQLDVPRVGCVTTARYKSGLNLEVSYKRLVPMSETKRRIALMISASEFMMGFANRGRMDVSNKPVSTVVVFDTVQSNEHYLFFSYTQAERDRYVAEVQARGGKVFISTETVSVRETFQAALDFLGKADIVDLSDETMSYDQITKLHTDLVAEMVEKGKKKQAIKPEQVN